MANFFTRFTDIINANLNDLLDRLEDPEKMIKQIIHEMEENIQQAKEGVIDAIASEKLLEKELEHHRRQSAEWERKAESALMQGKEELARSALTRKKEVDGILKNLVPAWETAKNTSERLKNQLKQLESKLDEARNKRSMLVARQRAAQAREQMERTMGKFQNGLQAQTKFERMEDRVAEIEARSEAAAELAAGDEVNRAFAALEVDSEVEAELAALKAKLAQ